ncbi:hypothetical protein SNOG_16553 [Parastagonospora nodorum SN15]|uniref:Uncharacterized protein n=1 Tax=Phaeosphaeria nodorum (strain SN15 / ATCC MYA-4574 / FGSC 10173) TaxID=321614 RepID=Q0TVB1_PHANO|nr:hypothetical protein SNOG_16553 [Parastagonospora nodorum SN15]EAT76093.1 hypothetical protein SNOG_16553 [Parastagonospora nodorum SN15]
MAILAGREINSNARGILTNNSAPTHAEFETRGAIRK